MTELRRRARGALPFLLAIAVVHLLVAWPGAGERGVIAEEIQPYLRHYPKVLDDSDGTVRYLPPNDDPALLAAVEERRDVAPRWVGTLEWPEIGYQGERRVWPVFVRAHQTAIGSYWGIVTSPLLGGGIAGVRRGSVLLGLALLGLLWAFARRLGLSRGWASVVAMGCALSPGFWFFGRTGYTFELASRLLLIATLWIAAPLSPLTLRRSVSAGATFAVAMLCRVPLPSALAPPLLLALVHPRRWAGWKRPALLLAIGGGIPIALIGLAFAFLPFARGSSPGASLPLEALGARTQVAPAVLAAQLAWVVDARVYLTPIAEGALRAPLGWVRPLLGGAVVALALVRWWHARAREPERMFVVALFGSALAGAWLYGEPNQFQLGMPLEPLFVLAVVAQLADLSRRHARAAWATLALLVGLRAITLVSLAASEARTDNPMLSGRAQRSLVEALQSEAIRGDDLITTAYDHVGVVEAWTDEAVRPIHAWRVLRAAGVPEREVVRRWRLVLDARPACHVLLTRAPSLVAGPFTDHAAVASGLERALAEVGGRIERRRTIAGDGGGTVFELVDITCPRSRDRGDR